ncbi:hypothetical protein RAZWK3B_15393 [Roseobacter sp. AzwK-3b]|nr:hypothetical protein [Roseobacter sp. AzwK-3b]EDM70794.1 hypothetical protein RAZWK3B_15393 [Roseobacter sp. AzwK-3b]
MTAHDRAMELVRQLRQEGLDVVRIVVEGRKIDVEIAQKDAPQQIDRVKW